MVSWVGDGLVAGYDTATNRLQPDRYSLASGGTVDLNGITRLQYNLPDSAPVLQKQNRLSISGSLNFTQTDLDNNPGTDNPLTNRGLALGAYLATDAQIRATGVTGVPTPQQILNVGLVKLGWWHADIIKKEPGTSAFNIGGWWPGYLVPGVKYWLLAIPVVRDLDWTNPGIQPMAGMNINALGRAISIWSNRKPAKPVITSPPNNTIVVPGTIMPFSFTSNDGDQMGTSDRYDRDIAGAQVVYAALPTEANPSPVWQELPFRRGDTGALAKASVYMYSQDVEPGDSRLAIINNLGFPLNIGGQLPEVAGQAALPPGQWQVKVRTADYGHPFPLLFNDPDTKYPGEWAMSNAPDANVSDWSDPIKVSVFEQVPPPILLTPIDNNAIAETAMVRLAWQYRNTVDPAIGGPYPQARRWVQIREVGKEPWHTILDGQAGITGQPGVAGESTILDLPAGFSPDVSPWMPPGAPAASTQYLTDLSFESGTLGGWTGSGLMGGVTLTNVAGTAGNGTHTGLRALRFVGNENVLVEMFRDVNALNDGHNTFTFNSWVRVNPDIGFMQFAMQFKDVSGNIVGSADLGSYIQQEIHPPGAEWGNEWIQVTATLKRPYSAVSVHFALQAVSRYMGYPLVFNPSAPNLAEWIRLDDVSLIGSYVAEPDPLTLDATNQYEWRARVEDAGDPDNGVTPKMSRWSEPARFWIVPAGNSGEVKPVPIDSIDGATLGCGTHKVFVYRRGGKERVGELTQMTHVDWNRVRDDISTAQVVMSGWNVDCGNLLKQLQTWAYELVIYRDNGYSVDRVWEGPISLITYEDDKVTIDAKDVMNYAYRRIIRQKMDDTKTGGTVVNRARAVLMNAFAPDDPNVLAYLNVINNESDARQYRSLPAYSRTAYEEIDDMAANAGLDYTCSGRSILLWGTKSRIGTLPEFRDEDLGAAPIVSEYGMSMSNYYSVSDGNGVHGEADRLNEADKDPIYGLVEMLSSTWASDSEEDTGTYTQEGIATVIESFEEHAERSIADRYPPPVVVRVPDNTTLSPTAVVSIQHLIPGVVIPLRSTGTLRTVVANQKLDKVTVVEEAGSERVSITLSPFSRDDTAPAEEV